jgi:hypothetical protein
MLSLGAEGKMPCFDEEIAPKNFLVDNNICRKNWKISSITKQTSFTKVFLWKQTALYDQTVYLKHGMGPYNGKHSPD